MKNTLYGACLLTLLACSGEKKPSQPPAKTPASTLAQPASGQTGSRQTGSRQTAADSSPVAGAGKWTYEEKVDQTGDRIYKASTTAPGRLNFGFPYEGGSVATLTLRHRSGSTYLYLEVSQGQFNRSFQGGSVRIGFDGQRSASYSFTAAENGRANIIFLDAVSTLIGRIKAARTMALTVNFDGQGTRRIDFRTAGLRWNH